MSEEHNDPSKEYGDTSEEPANTRRGTTHPGDKTTAYLHNFLLDMINTCPDFLNRLTVKHHLTGESKGFN